MKKKEKGTYGYRDSFKRHQAGLVGLLTLFILAQLGARFFTDSQAAKNILTVMAVVTVLPAANLASPLVAVLRYKTPPRDFYDTYSVLGQNAVLLYDLILTTKDDVLPMDLIAVHPTGIYGYCINEKADLKRAEAALNEVLKAHRLDPNLKLTGDRKTFDKRLRSLKPSSEYEDDGSVEYAVRVLKAMSM